MSANGLRGMGERTASAEDVPAHGVDWTAFVLSFKGVLLEGLEVAFIAVSFGLTAQALGSAVLGAAAAFVVIAGTGLLARGVVERIPRSALQLLVGTLLSSFGTFWAVEEDGGRLAGQRRRDPGPGRVVRAGGCRLRPAAAWTPGPAASPGGEQMTMIVGWLRGFGRFWYGFIIGDDWRVAATVAVALVVTWLLHAVAVAAWWLPPLAAMGVVGVSLRRADR